MSSVDEKLQCLRAHLQWAIELEHFTMPPYLCALYSLDASRNVEAVQVLSSVVVEEMLHLTLVANVLNAVGGRPRLDTPEMLRGYPRCLPHGDRSFDVSLLRFGPEALDVFLRIEQPAAPCAPPEGHDYKTIGQFYDAIGRGLRELCAQHGESAVFCGDPARQVTNGSLYSGGGRIIAVQDLPTALLALEEIVEQGEGADHLQVSDGERDLFHPEREEVGHYYRFQQLKCGRRFRRGDTRNSGPTGETISVDWEGVLPMQPNPRTADRPPGKAIRSAQEQFNLAYCALLQQLEVAFDGRPETLAQAIRAMRGLKVQAQALMRMPTEDGLATAGPTFEYVPSAVRGTLGSGDRLTRSSPAAPPGTSRTAGEPFPAAAARPGP